MVEREVPLNLLTKTGITSDLRSAVTEGIRDVAPIFNMLNELTEDDTTNTQWDVMKDKFTTQVDEISQNPDEMAQSQDLALRLIQVREWDEPKFVLSEKSIRKFSKIDESGNALPLTDERLLAMTYVGLRSVLESISARARMFAQDQYGTLSFGEANFQNQINDMDRRVGLEEGDIESGLTANEMRRRASVGYIALFFGPYYAQQSLRTIHESPDFGQQLGDWTRECPEAAGRLYKICSALDAMIDVGPEQTSRLVPEGCTTLDYARLRAGKLTLGVKYHEDLSKGATEWRSKEIQTSFYDVMDFLYGNDVSTGFTEKGDVYYLKHTSDNMKSRMLWVRSGENPSVESGFEAKKVDGLLRLRKFEARKSFTTSEGRVIRAGEGFILEELSNADVDRINIGELSVIPLMGRKPYEAHSVNPGCATLTNRAADIAHNASGDYWDYLLEKNGIKIEWVRDYYNPYKPSDRGGIDIGRLHYVGKAKVGRATDVAPGKKMGTLVTVRDLHAGTAKMFTFASSAMRAGGTEVIFDPTHSANEMRRVWELTTGAEPYEEAKQITDVDFRRNLVSQYPDWFGRLWRYNYVSCAILGKKIDITELHYPWEDFPDVVNEGLNWERLRVSLGAVDFGSQFGRGGKYELLVNERSALLRKQDHVGLDKLSMERLNACTTEVVALENERDEMRTLVEQMFMERREQRGDWNDEVLINSIYHNAFAQLYEGKTPEEVIDWLEKEYNSDFEATHSRQEWDKRGEMRVIRNRSGVVEAAVGMTRKECELLRGVSFANTIISLAQRKDFSTIESEDVWREYAALSEVRPELFKGRLGIMIWGGEIVSLSHVDYSDTSREHDNYLRYLMEQYSVYGASKGFYTSLIQVIDDKLMRNLEMKLFSPDSAMEGVQSEASEYVVEEFRRRYAKGKEIMGSASVKKMLEEVGKSLGGFVRAHAEKSGLEKELILRDTLAIMDSQVQTGLTYRYETLSTKNERDTQEISDSRFFIELDPKDPSLSIDESQLTSMLVGFFREKARVRVEFSKRTKGGRVLRSGGAAAYKIDGYYDTSDPSKKEWRVANLHKMGRIYRGVDKYGMKFLAKDSLLFIGQMAARDAGITTLSSLQWLIDEIDKFKKDIGDGKESSVLYQK